MGEFTNGESPSEIAANDKNQANSTDNTDNTDTESGFETDVKGINANDFVQHGTEKFPVFDVSQGEFMQNMSHGRKRLRFKSGTPAQSYMKGTRYNRPFYIRHTDGNGKTYSRKIK